MENEHIPAFFRFEDLRIYHKALDYINWVFKAAESFPEEEFDGLASRFIQAAESIAFNIAEGSARNKSQFIYYLKMAKSSVRECVVLTSIIQNLDYLSEQQISYSREQLMEMTKMLGALIGSLQRSNPPNRDQDDDSDDNYSGKYD